MAGVGLAEAEESVYPLQPAVETSHQRVKMRGV
jgi:hypothetical protein